MWPKRASSSSCSLQIWPAFQRWDVHSCSIDPMLHVRIFLKSFLNYIILKFIYKQLYESYSLTHLTHGLSQDQAFHAVQTEAFGEVRVPPERRHEGIPLQRPSLTSSDWGPPAGLGPPARPCAQDSRKVCEEAGRTTSGDHRFCRVI